MQKQNKINNLHNKVFNKQKEYNLLDTYHYMMKAYGYIPFEEFKCMDAGIVDELIDRIGKDIDTAISGTSGNLGSGIR